MEHTTITPPPEGCGVVNIGKPERLASIGLGMGLLCGALRLNGFLKYTLIVGAGGYLLYRGLTGHCPISHYLEKTDIHEE
ncbi:MAG TPA: DUF2892 domain-containing protein [Anseongella sp.]